LIFNESFEILPKKKMLNALKRCFYLSKISILQDNRVKKKKKRKKRRRGKKKEKRKKERIDSIALHKQHCCN
jgi:hypothetical protein